MFKLRQCNQKEFLSFIKNYKSELIVDISGIYEPPLKRYIDPNIKDWPDCIVATVVLTNNQNQKEKFFITEK